MFYVKSRDVDGSHSLFQSEDKEECLDYMKEWAGQNATKTGKDELVTMYGSVVYVDSISPLQEEVWNIRECWEYEEAIQYFCKNEDCAKCKFYEDVCLIKKAFDKL
jgi:hypothetical protein